MKNEQHSRFPKNFFTQPRPTISMKESLKDVIPFKWSDDVLKGKSKIKIVSAKKS